MSMLISIATIGSARGTVITIMDDPDRVITGYSGHVLNIVIQTLLLYLNCIQCESYIM